MKLLKIFIAVLFLLMPFRLISQGNSDSTKTIKFSNRIPLELELEMKVKETFAIGYANCFQGSVLNVVKGKLNDTKLLITVVAGDTLNYGLLSRAGENDILKISFVFNKANEPYSTTYVTGFVDSDKNSWRIISILKP